MPQTPAFDGAHVARTGPRGDVPVVFLHGLGLDSTWWAAQFAEFGDRRDVVALDLPGHGRSGRLDQTPTFGLLAGVLHDVVTAVGAPVVDLVGVSLGGMIAQHYALAHPTRVRSLTLVATLCDFDAPVRDALRQRAHVAREEGMARIAELSTERWFPPDFRARRPDIVDRAKSSLEAQDQHFHAAMWEMISDLDLADRLPGITCPTWIVVGASDPSAQAAMGEKMSRLIPDATLTVLDGVGHFPPVEVPASFNGLMSAFLDAVDRRP